jgi:dihydroorotate dehydrogenase
LTPVYALARPLLFRLDAERAHALALASLEAAYRSGASALFACAPIALPTPFAGLALANPVGLAAGLDKNAAHVDALAALGFGFLEVGTTTPRPQPGNPRPRMFRLPEHAAIINRLGFNNDGVDALVRNLERTRYGGVLGVNIGRNRDTPNERAVDDYLFCLERVYAHASYVTVNVSSPNTAGLRDLQDEDALRRLVGRLRDAQERLAGRHGARKPLLLKIAPDLTDARLDAMAAVLLEARIDGVICTNTTVARPGVERHRHAGEAGGLSGRPLFEPSTHILRAFATRVGSAIPLIGVGGILDGADAAAKIAAGAGAVQLYTGMVYRGPGLARECVAAIAAAAAAAR